MDLTHLPSAEDAPRPVADILVSDLSATNQEKVERSISRLCGTREEEVHSVEPLAEVELDDFARRKPEIR